MLRCSLRISNLQRRRSAANTPEGISDDEACTLQVAGTTAWMATNGTRPIGHPGGKGEAILIQGTGGAPINVLLIAKASGAEGKPTCYFIPTISK